MPNEKRLRLLQVAKEFKVGLSTITEYLEKKGVQIENSPNSVISQEVYEILESARPYRSPRCWAR